LPRSGGAVDSAPGAAQYRRMARTTIAALAFALLLAACGGDPRDYGITGPGAAPPLPPSATFMQGASDLSGPADLPGLVGGPDPESGSERYWRNN
jgi:hypothetical protein